MKASDFAQILKKLIKEEVRLVIREELKSALMPIILEQKKTKSQIAQTKQPMPLPKQKPQKDFGITMKGPLGDILRETANDLRNGTSAPIQESSQNDWADMGHYDASDAKSFGHMQEDEDFGSLTHLANDPTAPFMKDYSDVLKSSYEHSGVKQ